MSGHRRLIKIGSKQWLMDFTVRNPLAPSHVADAAADPKRVLQKAEQEKHRKYDALAASTNSQLVAFAVESTGRIGEEALRFIKELIKEAASYKVVWAPRQVVYGIYREVVMAVVKGNTGVFASNYRKCQAAALSG